MSLQNLVKYYNLCYQADNRGLIVKNLFSKSVENKLIFDDFQEELITGYLPYFPLDKKYGEETAKKITLAEKEKELIYCSTFIIGNDENWLGNSKNVCSPLFMYPAKITESEEEYSLEIDREGIRINFQIFNELNTINGDTSKFYELLFQTVIEHVVDNQTIGKIIKLIDDYTINIDTSNLLSFPTLFSEKAIKNIYTRKAIKEEGKFMIVPAAGLAVVKKSVNTRGIINELTAISEASYFSEPLRTIFSNAKIIESINEEIGQVPAVLNNAQKGIIDNSAKFPFSVIIGPPGTGKTYTISALAIEKMSIGKSVLIVSKTDKAVDIIAEKIENQLNLPNVLVRAGRKSYKNDLIKFLDRILSNNHYGDANNSSKELYKIINKKEKRINKIKNKFAERTEDELKWGHAIAENKTHIIADIKRKYINWRNSILDNHFELIKQLQLEIDERNRLVLEFIKTKYDENIDKALENDRNDINNLRRALKSRRGTKQENLFNSINYNVLLKVFPIWLVKMSDIYNVLPLKPELFDYVIIDEATQCDIASTIPILQRGKKAVITGDPNQLRHFSFLSATQQEIFKEKLDIQDIDDSLTDYKNKSILDAVAENAKSNNQFVFLDEHYRSLPAIIRFSNKKIYDSALKIMTSRPSLKNNEGIIIVKCTGQRLKAGYNKEEAQKVLEIVKETISSESHLHENICSSIGILSPFRDQVEYISNAISTEFALSDIKKHQISINTPYGFQGDERDIMILSFAVDNKTNAMAFRYMNKDDVFNVSITRARKVQYIIHSLDTKTLKTDSLLRQYLESFEKYEQFQESKNQNIKDNFTTEVKKELEKKGFEVHEAFNVAGLDVDIVATKNDKNFGIDLIGYPGVFQGAFTLERYKMLTRAGLPTYPIAYTYWKADKKMCMQNFIEITQD
ncbi:MAG: AAA family ATPase [Bacteroidales bacterium]|nr:AAA family ATPase [Bacteroidales bacterium]